MKKDEKRKSVQERSQASPRTSSWRHFENEDAGRASDSLRGRRHLDPLVPAQRYIRVDGQYELLIVQTSTCR